MNVLVKFCSCGHLGRYHVDHTDIGLGKYCVGKFDPDCKCIEFKLDNLKYLEDLNEYTTS